MIRDQASNQADEKIHLKRFCGIGLAKLGSEFDVVRPVSSSILSIERIEINDMITLQFKNRSNQDHNEQQQQQFFDFFS